MKIGMLLDQDFSLAISGGHIAIGQTDWQNAAVIMAVNSGEIRQTPTLGVGIDAAVNDNDFDVWNYEIRRQLKEDGIEPEAINLENGFIEVY